MTVYIQKNENDVEFCRNVFIDKWYIRIYNDKKRKEGNDE